jgi:hypothetical protein
MSISTTSGGSRRTRSSAAGPVVGLAGDLYVVLRLEDHAQATAHERLVVGDDDTDHDGVPSRGSRARSA